MSFYNATKIDTLSVKAAIAPTYPVDHDVIYDGVRVSRVASDMFGDPVIPYFVGVKPPFELSSIKAAIAPAYPVDYDTAYDEVRTSRFNNSLFENPQPDNIAVKPFTGSYGIG